MTAVIVALLAATSSFHLPAAGVALVRAGLVRDRGGARRVLMGVRRKAPTGVSQENARARDTFDQAAAGGGGIFPTDDPFGTGDPTMPSLDAYKRKPTKKEPKPTDGAEAKGSTQSKGDKKPSS